ncbi:MAG: tol-pal system-associated acyl-CoA thioesterase [Alphaproteobacteria bacterium]|nr:tol-pal system-associated acyl-CoA thioesterase [Alphaproteobacteria bacterium]
MKHKFPIRVYYEDTDAGGIVYHSNFLNFCERARCEMLRDLGYQVTKIAKDFGLMFVIKHADVEYISPGRLDDSLEVVTSIADIKNTSFKMTQIVEKSGQILCKILITVVCVDIQSVKPVRLPDELRTAFDPYLERMT